VPANIEGSTSQKNEENKINIFQPVQQSNNPHYGKEKELPFYWKRRFSSPRSKTEKIHSATSGPS
jgi:hypothetical protein